MTESVHSRWSKKLAARHALLSAAIMRRAPRPVIALRKAQIAKAERVLARHPAAPRTVSRAGDLLVEEFEGFRAAPYQDSVGVWTIGFGETHNVGPGTPHVTEEQATEDLHRRLDEHYLPFVLAACDAGGYVPTQRELNALVSLAWNLGVGIFDLGHTMGDAIRVRPRRAHIADAFLVYVYAGSKVLPGLVSRRRAERRYFLTGKV